MATRGFIEVDRDTANKLSLLLNPKADPRNFTKWELETFLVMEASKNRDHKELCERLLNA